MLNGAELKRRDGIPMKFNVGTSVRRLSMILFTMTLFCSLFAAQAYADDSRTEYDPNPVLQEEAVGEFLQGSSKDDGIQLLGSATGSGGFAKVVRVYGSTIMWQVKPKGPAGGSFTFLGTLYVKRYSAGKYKFVKTVVANGGGLYINGYSQQVNLGLRKGSYQVTLQGSAIGPGGLSTVLPNVSVGFSI